MTSTNSLGTTQITLQFDLNRNIDAAAQDVQTGIDAAGGQLPKNLPTPPHLPQGQSRRFADLDSFGALRCAAGRPRSTITPKTSSRSRSRRFPGIAQVSIGGQQKPAVRVQIDPAKLAALGIAAGGRRAASSAPPRVDAPKGSINGPTRSLTIYDNDQCSMRQALERRRGRLQERRAGAHPRHRRRGRWPGEPLSGRLGAERRTACSC